MSLEPDTSRCKAPLEPSEDKYRLLLETINEAVFEVDAAGSVIYISSGIQKIMGFAPEEVIGQPFIHYVADEDRQRLLERFAELADGVVRSSEYRVVDKSGRRRWVETFSQPRYRDGRFTGLVGVMTDIHQRKLVEEESDRRQQLLEATFNATADGIIAFDQMGRILTWNRRFEEMWALPGERIAQMQSLAALRAALAGQLAEEEGRRGAKLFDWRAGQEVHTLALKGARIFEVVSCPLSRQGPDAGLVWNFRDISSAKQTEAALLRSEEKFSKLFHASPIWSELVSLEEGRFIEVNQAFLNVTGFARRDVIGATSSELGLWPEDVDRAEIVAHFDRHHRLDALPCRFRMGDGQTRHFLWSAEAVALEGERCLISSLLDVTVQHRMQQALLESEERYRSLYNNIPVGLFRTTPQGHILSANPALVDLFGYDSEKAFLAQSSANLYARPDVRRKMLAELNRDGAVFWEAIEFRRRDGSTFWGTLSATKIVGRDGEFLFLDGVIQDVTERQLAAEKLQEEKRFSETVVNSLPGVFYLYDEDGRLKRWNRNLEKLSALTPERLGKMRFRDWFAADDQVKAAEAFGAVLAEGEGQAEIPVQTPRGHRRRYLFNGYKLTIDGASYLLGVGLDVSKQKKLETALRESEARFRQLVEKMPFGICIAVDGQIIYRNPAQEKLFGPLEGRLRLEDAPLADDDRQRYLAACRFAETRQQAVEALELGFRTGHGPRNAPQLTWMHCSIHPIDYRGRKALLIAMVDLTRIKELEQQVLIREKMASLGHVAAGIAHEIRNPLSGINVLLESIRENFADPDAAEDILQLLDETQKASDKIARVIRRVLDFSKPTAVKMALSRIAAPVEEAIQLTKVTLRKNGIALDQRLDPNLPRLYIDPQLIEQVVLNLINNAVAALSHQEGEKRILITNRREGEYLSICVADSGAGVSEPLKAKIFEPYFTTRSDGSGIGLSLCQRIANDHGGTIEVLRSDTLGGAEFRLRLPLEKRKHPR